MFHRYLDNERSLHSLKSPAPRAWPELGRAISRGQQPLTADTAATGARGLGGGWALELHSNVHTKVPNHGEGATAFTFKALLRHCAKLALTHHPFGH